VLPETTVLSAYAVVLSGDVLIIVYGPPGTVPRYMLQLTAFVEAVQVGSTVCWVAPVPVPVIVCTAGEFEALLENDKEAEAGPLGCGVKATVKEWIVPQRSSTSNCAECTSEFASQLSDSWR
jgi:hypothetical protein